MAAERLLEVWVAMSRNRCERSRGEEQKSSMVAVITPYVTSDLIRGAVERGEPYFFLGFQNLQFFSHRKFYKKNRVILKILQINKKTVEKTIDNFKSKTVEFHRRTVDKNVWGEPSCCGHASNRVPSNVPVIPRLDARWGGARNDIDRWFSGRAHVKTLNRITPSIYSFSFFVEHCDQCWKRPRGAPVPP